MQFIVQKNITAWEDVMPCQTYEQAFKQLKLLRKETKVPLRIISKEVKVVYIDDPKLRHALHQYKLDLHQKCK